MIFKNGLVLDKDFKFVNKDIGIKDGMICAADSTDADTVTDCEGCYVLPGLIDIHTHGAVGYDNMDAVPEAHEAISRFMAQNGVTTYLPTIMTHNKETLMKAAKNIREAAQKGTGGANIGGIYMEGPYFSVKYKGAQNEEYIRLPDVGEFEEINAASGGLIKIAALAPELDGAMEFIDAERGSVKISIGHTDADYETAMEAIAHGASGITHIFNAMRGFHHRMPNVIGAAMESDVMCECICDGFHLSRVTVRMLYKTVGAKRMVLISDSLRAAGMADGEYELAGQKFFVKDGKARLEDGTIAGSTEKLFDSVKNAVDFGIPIEEAVMMASANPARAAGIYDICGSIEEGKRADIIIADKELCIKNVIVNGRIYR